MTAANTEGKDVLLAEIRKSFETQLDLKKNLESKATNTITVSGLIITLLFGFSTFLLKGPLQSENYYYIPILLSIILSIIALLCALRSLRITEYSYVLIDNQVNGPKLQDVVDQLMRLDNDSRLERLIDSYVASIKINSFQNQRNAGYISVSQTLLFVAILSIGVTIALVVIPFILKIFFH